jgi:maltose alpha-D-glucosyltransferase/alpha-amylase
VLTHRAAGPSGSMLFLRNLGAAAQGADLGKLTRDADNRNPGFGNQGHRQVDGLRELNPDPYGYRWIRLSCSRAGCQNHLR